MALPARGKLMRSPVIALMAAVLLLAGCAQPVPADKAGYVGEWQSPTMALLITQDGTVMYERRQAGGSTSIEGPLKEFVADDFMVGIGPLATTFEVSVPPHRVGGEWRMVVDGVELTRAAAVDW